MYSHLGIEQKRDICVYIQNGWLLWNSQEWINVTTTMNVSHDRWRYLPKSLEVMGPRAVYVWGHPRQLAKFEKNNTNLNPKNLLWSSYGGQVVSEPAIYSVDPSLNPPEAHSLSEKNKNKQKREMVGPI